LKHPERAIQQHIAQLLRAIGASVWELGTTRSTRDFHMGTRQTPGLPDIIAFLPAAPGRSTRPFVVEAKAPGGRLRPAQKLFRECCVDSAVAHVTGGLDDVIAWLTQHGYLRPDQVASHHHQPQPAAERPRP